MKLGEIGQFLGTFLKEPTRHTRKTNPAGTEPLRDRYGEEFAPLASVLKLLSGAPICQYDRTILNEIWSEKMAKATVSNDQLALEAGYRLLIDSTTNSRLLRRRTTS